MKKILAGLAVLGLVGCETTGNTNTKDTCSFPAAGGIVTLNKNTKQGFWNGAGSTGFVRLEGNTIHWINGSQSGSYPLPNKDCLK